MWPPGLFIWPSELFLDQAASQATALTDPALFPPLMLIPSWNVEL